MKTLKLHFLFCVLSSLFLMAACSDDDNATGGKQSYSCFVTIKTEVNDTTQAHDEVYQAALKAEAELLRNKLTGALGLDSLCEFVFQATDTTSLKAGVGAKCDAALANLGDSWKGYHQVVVYNFLDGNQLMELYNKPFGKRGGSNSDDAVVSGTAKAKLDGTNEVDVAWVQLWEDGPKWATVNVGVTDPTATTSYGGYYNWGGHTDLGSNGYIEDCNTDNANLYGTNDTATRLWGDQWRMPSNVEFVRLLEASKQGKCEITRTSRGVLVTGNMGKYASNSIFLPYAGKYLFQQKVYDAGKRGGYWTSTHSYQNSACYFNIDTDGVQTGYDIVGRGFSIRPVLKEECANIPDATLRSLLVNGDMDGNKYDANEDGEISPVEVTAVTSLNCSGCGITDLTGLENSVKMTNLNISNNPGITSVNLTMMPDLRDLNAGNTGITTLDLSQNTKLQSLSVGYTGLTELNLNYAYTALTSLDVAGCGSLKNLYLYQCTGLTSLNLTNDVALKDIFVPFCTNLTSIDMTNCPAVENVILWDCTALSTLTGMKKTARMFVTTENSDNKAKLNKSIYQIGQLVQVDDKRNFTGSPGVVYTVNDNGQVKIISADEGKTTFGYDGVDTGTDSDENGWWNTQRIPNSPAAQWCTNHGYGWYLPALDELAIKYLPKNVNETLEACGYARIAFDSSYWTSTEVGVTDLGDHNSRVVLFFDDGDFQRASKTRDSNVRVRAFYRVSY